MGLLQIAKDQIEEIQTQGGYWKAKSGFPPGFLMSPAFGPVGGWRCLGVVPLRLWQHGGGTKGLPGWGRERFPDPRRLPLSLTIFIHKKDEITVFDDLKTK